MYHAKKFSTASLVPHKPQSSQELANVGVVSGGSSVKSPTPSGGGSGKQRLRWTSDLHDRFVDAITQLGGPDRLFTLQILLMISFLVLLISKLTFPHLGRASHKIMVIIWDGVALLMEQSA
ncbi:hypothetical protein C1H46_020000 [Malus baccata]|uniref:MYB-CC type transcription factor LHEQLE-containing domain-containing protein n=1 Tax=Malus baccata TaxID=106549 RepID=A0A540M6M0_MALBA|nr:hypothetical protein C1H46_020000 [Malus baccata]